MSAKISNPSRWASIALLSALIGGAAHWNNFLSPIHEFGHFMWYEDRGLVISTHWDKIIVKESRPVGLTKGFSFELTFYSFLFMGSLLGNAPIVTGIAAGCLISTYFYANASTDFDDFKKLTAGKIEPNYIHDWWEKRFFLFTIPCGIAFFVFARKRL